MPPLNKTEHNKENISPEKCSECNKSIPKSNKPLQPMIHIRASSPVRCRPKYSEKSPHISYEYLKFVKNLERPLSKLRLRGTFRDLPDFQCGHLVMDVDATPLERFDAVVQNLIMEHEYNLYYRKNS